MNEEYVLLKYTGPTKYGLAHNGDLTRVPVRDWLAYTRQQRTDRHWHELARGTEDEMIALIRINRS